MVDDVRCTSFFPAKTLQWISLRRDGVIKLTLDNARISSGGKRSNIGLTSSEGLI